MKRHQSLDPDPVEVVYTLDSVGTAVPAVLVALEVLAPHREEDHILGVWPDTHLGRQRLGEVA